VRNLQIADDPGGVFARIVCAVGDQDDRARARRGQYMQGSPQPVTQRGLSIRLRHRSQRFEGDAAIRGRQSENSCSTGKRDDPDLRPGWKSGDKRAQGSQRSGSASGFHVGRSHRTGSIDANNDGSSVYCRSFGQARPGSRQRQECYAGRT
jgi:hypothetical protein